ncbi:transglutaminase family protein [Schumannella sp. 10F1B-5-1]|uniref:transglutaminase family protein n=1 Tax=Schumannella sp. 10F1B-5-1 TaxID=2590780 RepID=UPI0011312196|nr:transglutaminase family protein [Schumannella sp. 10F1B-5-1]TPW78436.1 transglutaminase family protein [Schumannella sp. 10F1B-5-1]
MKRLRIRHQTGFRYEGEATASYNEARMLPSGAGDQLVLYSHLDIAPVSSTHAYTDYWGSRVTSFEVLTAHRELTLTATSLVEVRPREHPHHDLDWEGLAAAVETRSEYVEQLGQTGRTRPPAEVVELARSLADAASSPCEAAMSIARTIGERIEYVPGVTGVTTTAEEAWEHQKGVCQDITHLVLGALRSVGIPARYVSGYLHPVVDAQVGETVTGESHAWVEWYCGGWRGFDPTNLIDIGDRHVIVGFGRDYNDVPPLRGVFAGPSSSAMFVTVEITREA